MLTIYKASAGSGKTFQLARKYIQLILGFQNHGIEVEEGLKPEWELYPDNYESHGDILAITFTNKATAEMKKRIIQELAILADDNLREKSDHLEYFEKLFNKSPEIIGDRAKAALKGLLKDFKDFNVSTIDSFFQIVLRNFANELDLPDNFELKLDDEEIIGIAIEDLLNTVNGNSVLVDYSKDELKEYIPRVSKWLIKYMEQKLTDGTNFNLFNRDGRFRNDLVKFIYRLMDETFKQNADMIMEWFGNHGKVMEFEKQLLKNIGKIDSLLEKSCEEIVANQPLLNSDFSNLLIKIKDGELPKSDSKTWEHIVNWSITPIEPEKDKLRPFIKAAFFKKGVFDESYINYLRKFCISLVRLIDRKSLYKLLLKNIYPLGLFGETIKRIEGYRKKNNAFLLSDTNSFLNRIIKKSDVLFLYEKLGTRLQHYLLDEFQDTSVLQWENLRPLVEESLSYENDNLIIGDEKQCIYRFRNSDPELINRKVSEDIPSALEKGEDREENTNRRSKVNIVRFNNSIFLALAQILDVCSYYRNTIQTPWSKEELKGGYVNLAFTEKYANCNVSETEGDDGTTEIIQQDIAESEKETENYEFTFEWIKKLEEHKMPVRIALDRMATNIVRQLKAGYRPNEIAVLVRKNSEGDKVIRCLLQLFDTIGEELPLKPEVVSGDALRLNDSPLVRYVISKLKLSVLPEKVNPKGEEPTSFENNLAKRLRFRKLFNHFNLQNTKSFGSKDMDAASSKALQTSIAEADKEAGVNTVQPDYFDNNLVPVVENILADFCTSVGWNNGKKILSNENVYISALIDRIMEFESYSGNNLYGFLKWWDEKGKDSPVGLSENLNAVTVTTIHKSKGLEYKCVHVPFVNMQVFPSSSHNRLHWFRLSPLDGSTGEVMPPFIPLHMNKTVGSTPVFKKEYEEIQFNDRLDVLNIVYVAFTRAVDELVVTVIGPCNFDIDNSKCCISGAVYEAVNKMESTEEGRSIKSGKEEFLLPLEEYFNGIELEIGEPLTRVIHDDKKKDTQDQADMPGFHPRAAKVLVEVTKPMANKGIDWDNDAERGTFFHEILQHVRYWDDLDYAVRLVGYRHKMSPERLAEAKRILEESFAELKEHKAWFTSFESVLSEIPIYHFEEDKESRRIDRIMVFPDGSVEIVDFKFGKDVGKNHDQVRKYMRFALEAGYTDVKGYLWYPLKNKVDSVFV